MSNKKHHAEWLSLLEISGPFVSLPVLEKVFPQGLDAHDADHARRMRLAFGEWETNQFGPKPNPAIHNAWVQFVLKETLTLPDEVLASGQSIPQTLKATHSEAGEIIRPDLVVRNPTGVPDAGKPRMVIQVYPASQHLEKHVHGLRWKASPADRMAELLKQTKCQVGLVTNGEHWILTNKTEELPTGFASFYSSLWLEEPVTLRAFRNLLEARRFFGVLPGQTLEEMLVESATNQQEVTDQLGLQVRRAVEVLIQSLDRADQDDKVLAGVPETVLYEAALTVMMRLVFLFCAEERELLLLGDPLYDQHYAVSTLVAQLQETADNHGEEILERRLDAWSRLLSTFRAVYGGVQHERMKLPAYAGDLFDPDRFPFLEGRRPKTSWKDTSASPLPVNNRTVLHLLRSLQYLQIHGEAQRISFRALGIEQIGHVYEGLLDHTAKRANEPCLGVKGSKGLEPEIALSKLEERLEKGEDELVKFLKDETGRSESGIRSSLGVELEEEAGRLRAACGNDNKLYDRVLPFAGLIHNDSFDRPVVIRKGSVYVTSGTDRRSSGTHYTPTSLTEPIVQYTLEPLCYIGPAEGKPEDEWQLRPAKELLDLKICDMACGSGAFLVQACRFLSELLVESWEQAAEKAGGGKPVKDLRITPYGEPSTGAPDEQLIPQDTEERLVYARRLVAQRCLYGVDKNPLAVEMAKLSLWLLTLAKDKPFTFLDHCVRAGDSLVGICSIEQLLRFSLDERVSTGPLLEQQRKQIEKRLDIVKMLRRQIEEQPSNTPQDIERKEAMLKNADEQTRRLTYAADLLLAASWQPMTAAERESTLNATLIEVEYKFKDLPVEELDVEAKKQLRKSGQLDRFHWPLEFPEVFERGGFSAFICNPPFMGGRKISSNFGDSYERYIKSVILQGSKGSINLVLYFILRGCTFLRPGGASGFIATDSITESDTREVGMTAVFQQATAFRSVASRPWPGDAGVRISLLHSFRGEWKGKFIVDGKPADGITTMLQAGVELPEPTQLVCNDGYCSDGVKAQGIGFVVTEDEAQAIIKQEPSSKEVLTRYIVGDDLNNHPFQLSSRWIVNFWNKPEAESKKYPTPWRILVERVKPYRDTLTKQVHESCFWKFWDRREEFFNRVREKGKVLVSSKLSKHLAFGIGDPRFIYSEKVKVFDLSSFSAFAVLQSSLHIWWSLQWGSSTGETPAYVGSRCFATFPFPRAMIGRDGRLQSAAQVDGLEALGREYLQYRKIFMESIPLGMTDIYNRFHDSDDTSADIQKLRDLHVEMDHAVAVSYDWSDLRLGHGFHPTKQGERFTISETARRDVLQRLLKLNHERYTEEVKQGLHEKKGKAKKTNTGKGSKKNVPSGPSLFGDDDDEEG